MKTCDFGIVMISGSVFLKRVKDSGTNSKIELTVKQKRKGSAPSPINDEIRALQRPLRVKLSICGNICEPSIVIIVKYESSFMSMSFICATLSYGIDGFMFHLLLPYSSLVQTCIFMPFHYSWF
ncbi:hypothetical protein AtEden1_Chr4g0296891 [Arabidopsis thaliana]